MLPTALLSLLREYRSEQFREWYKPREVDTRCRSVMKGRPRERSYMVAGIRHQRSHLDVKVVENLLFTTSQAKRSSSGCELSSLGEREYL